MNKYKVIVAGSRSFNDYGLLVNTLDEVLPTKEIIIVSGAARGADQMGEEYAKERGYEIERYPANWIQYGRSAGYIRNTKMAEVSQMLVAFWDGVSPGTKHMINIAKEKGLKVITVKF